MTRTFQVEMPPNTASSHLEIDFINPLRHGHSRYDRVAHRGAQQHMVLGERVFSWRTGRVGKSLYSKPTSRDQIKIISRQSDAFFAIKPSNQRRD